MPESIRGTGDLPVTIRSGIGPLDKHLGGGVAAGRIHVLTGGVGTGKTTACLQFLGAGIGRGERALMLTASRPADIRAHAAFAGVPIDGALREDRLVVLRFRPGFVSRFAHAASTRVPADDLRRMIGAFAPTRVVIDPVVPFLGDGSPVGEGLQALAELIEELGATTLLTYPGDIAKGGDRRFDGLTERAATIIHFDRDRGGGLSLAVLRASGVHPAAGPLPFAIAARSGIVHAPAGHGQMRESHGAASPATRRRLLLMHITSIAAPDILELLQQDYEVTVSAASSPAPGGQDAAHGVGAIVIETNHSALAATRALIQRFATGADSPPIIVIVRFNLRSIDRARLLRAGADEVLATDMGPAELLQRLTAAVSRGHLDTPLVHYSERLLLQADVSAGRQGPLDHSAFTGALAAHVAHDRPAQYTVVSLAPGRVLRGTDAAAASLAALADLVMRTARVGSGDLVGCTDARVVVYLHGARRGDASSFVDRVRSAWPTRERGSIEVEFLSNPPDEHGLESRVEAARQ